MRKGMKWMGLLMALVMGVSVASAEMTGAITVVSREDGSGTRSAVVRNGDVFVRDLRSGALTQLTRSLDPESRLLWSRDGALVWRSGEAWYRWDGRNLVQAAQLKTEDAPGSLPKPDDLHDRQLRLIETLKNDRDRRDAASAVIDAWRTQQSDMRAMGRVA